LLVLVAPGVNGLPLEGVYTNEQDREFDEAVASGDLERAATIGLLRLGPAWHRRALDAHARIRSGGVSQTKR